MAILLCACVVWHGCDSRTADRFIKTTHHAHAGGNVTTISPRVAGFVAEILVADNDYVRAGQLLVSLDKRDFQAAYDRSLSDAAARRATLAGVRVKYLLQQSIVAEAAADLDAKSAILAREDTRRYAKLAATSAASRQDARETGAKDREGAALLSAEANLEAARRELSVLGAEVIEACATSVRAEAEVQTARLDLRHTDIRSPIDGYVGNRAARAGTRVSEGAHLLTIIPAYGLWVDVDFNAHQRT